MVRCITQNKGVVGSSLIENTALCLEQDTLSSANRRMAENEFAPPPPREFCRHILSCRKLKAESVKRCLHSVLRDVSL